MCGRINVSDNEGVRILLEMLGMDTWPTQEPRYNIAPTQTVDVVKLGDELEFVPMHWGVSLTLPGKTKNPDGSKKLITKHIQNSRSDKVWESRMWKKLIAERRGLVPVNGFYEWKRRNRKLQAANYITPAKADAIFFAGIYRESKAEGKMPEVSVINTEANKSMSKVHDRMPVILNSQNAAMAWLQDDDRDGLVKLMKPAFNNALKITEVSDYVNNFRHESPECIEPLAA